MMRRFRASTENLRNASLEYQRTESWTLALNRFLVGATTLVAIGLALQGTYENGQWVTAIPAGQLISIAGIIAMMTGPIWVVQMMLWTWRQAKVSLKRIQQLELIDPTVQKTEAIEHPQATLPLHYINPRSSGMTAQDYTRALVQELRVQHPTLRVLASEPNPMIFQGTLKELITAGTTSSTDAELCKLLQLTDSLEIAHRLGGTDPAHYFEANINSEGANLSGGQKQRLALTRALAQPASYLVLCEPLNSVDEPSQKYIYDQLEEHLSTHQLLSKIEQIFVISTTAEVQRRIEAHTKQEGEYA
ncbi:ATP-binding cassette domain-containing protein [uncultured Rothia sp.]|uniref:ATP-binding cassette domain-containing protein n=1 Tax=uncultured Rothia sp. TaxID=316088 RepID=UPI0032177EFE